MHFKTPFAVILTTALLATSCSTSRNLWVQEPATQPTHRVFTGKRVPVSSYTTIDGRHHRFVGFVEPAGDSLRFIQPHQRSHTLEADQEEVMVLVPRDSVKWVRTTRVEPIGTAVLIGMGAGLIYFAGAFSAGTGSWVW